ncbi:MAG: S8 family serine peptidase [Bacillota bacterium]
MTRPAFLSVLALALTAACATTPTIATPKPNIDSTALPSAEEIARGDSIRAAAAKAPEPVLPPADAFRRGWMPLSETGVDLLLRAHPTFDGRGVLIAILDSGIDAGIDGLGTTSAGERKILDLRDFSGEGAVPLSAVSPQGDAVEVAGHRLAGFGRVAALAAGGAVYGGMLREIPLGDAPAGDVNGNGIVGDSLPVVVARASDGWVLFADTDGDGSLADEKPVRDFLAGHETFGWHAAGRPAPLTVAVNFGPAAAGAPPTLDLFFDTSGHGTHVSGIAAGHDLYGVPGFNGVAPGAALLGCKIADDAQGAVTTTGSMIRALDYAIRFAAERRLPLVVNMSFGVGNETEGGARIDALVDSVLAAHPDVIFVVSAGNDGPGLSTLGFPASASRVITVGATLPSVFLADGTGPRPLSPLAAFSARGGELAKPDIVTPGMAYSTVPRWHTGEEREGGTSMASPHASGLAALLVSAVAPRRVDAATIRQALMVTARPVAGSTFLDEGAGLPDAARALRWLERDLRVHPVQVTGPAGRGSAAYQIVEPGRRPDTTATFGITTERTDTFRLRSSVPWLHAPSRVVAAGQTSVRLTYDAHALSAPGVHTGVVSGWTSDTLAGPAFRLVNTVVVAHSTAHDLALRAQIAAGGVHRLFFLADSERPFTVSAESSTEGTMLYLHEPDGMPYRGGNGASAGTGDSAAVYDVGGRDVAPGVYEAVATAPPLAGTTVGISVRQSPVVLRLSRDRTGLGATLLNLQDSALSVRTAVILAGAERNQITHAQGSAVQRIRFIAPAWARGVVIETTMDRTQWGRFTDFGVTLFDSAGRQLGTEPLNYALGRLQVAFTAGHADMPVEIGMFPGFADTTDAARGWTVKTSIRLYADSARTLAAASGEVPVTLRLPARGSADARFVLPADLWPLGDGFFPLAAVVAEAGGTLWSREVGLPLPAPPVMR